MDPVSIFAMCFADVSALDALFSLFRRWREKKQKKASKAIADIEGAFTKVPLLIKQTCESCLARAGDKFRFGDALAERSITRTTKNCTRTLEGMFRLALNGDNTLDLISVQGIVRGFGRETVHNLVSFFDSVSRGQTASSERASIGANVRTPCTARAVVVSSRISPPPYAYTLPQSAPTPPPLFGDLKVSADFAKIEVPALRPLECTTTLLKATLDALQQDSAIEQFTSSLRVDLDMIEARAAGNMQQVHEFPTYTSGSWETLRRIRTQA